MNKRIIGSCLVGWGAMMVAVIAASTSVAEPISTVESARVQHKRSLPRPDADAVTPMDAQTCSYGYFVCPDNNEIFDYAGTSECVAICGTMGTKAQVAAICDANCVATCQAHQWFAC